jgi:hypothetical protein
MPRSLELCLGEKALNLEYAQLLGEMDHLTKFKRENFSESLKYVAFKLEIFGQSWYSVRALNLYC